MDELYKEWIEYLFNRPENEWYWNPSKAEVTASDEDLVHLISRLFKNSDTDLEKFSDTQIAYGLKYIFDHGISNTIFSICQKGGNEDLKIEAVSNMKYLYRNCLARRCKNQLSHNSDTEISPLNSFCYMLWDTSALGSWKSVVLDVMEDALYIPNNSCIESALHGLGHRQNQDKIKVPEIIDRFLRNAQSLDPALRIYAQNAKTGYIQ